MRPQPDSSQTFNRRIVFAVISIALVLLVIVGVVFVKNQPIGSRSQNTLSPTAVPTHIGTVSVTVTTNVNASPLLFGTNLGLFTSNDQVVTSASTRALMQQIHIRIVRIPARMRLACTRL